MKGIELSRSYYKEYGITMIREQFPDYEARIAVGLVGEGSECFGFDDDISADHDFGPSFCMWLTDDDYYTIGIKLSDAYEALPKEFMGYSRMITAQGGGRIGVHRIGAFYKRFTGLEKAPGTLLEWMYIPEEYLATLTNGEVFRDDLGEFSGIRKLLLGYYPEDIRTKKIADRAAGMAQSGQYNYSRCMRRGETVAARLAVDEFIRNTISMIYLLNRRYKPFYKWMHRGMEDLAVLPEIKGLIEQLADLPMHKEAWEKTDQKFWECRLNTDDKAVVIIESICGAVIRELHKQSLTDTDDSFLEDHKVQILSRIKDEQIRKMY